MIIGTQYNSSKYTAMKTFRFNFRITLVFGVMFFLVSSVMAQRTRSLQRETRFKQIKTSNVMIPFKAHTKVVLNAKNEVLEGMLASDIKISRPGWPETAVMLKGGTKVVFHSDGSPKHGTLAENANFILFGTMNKRLDFLAGGEIEIDKSFLVISGMLASEEILKTVSGKTMKFKKGNKLTFNSAGLVVGY